MELHLEWIRECFDPDGDGVYESYLNSWPTDSQWYNGGGTAEETSYAYRGHLAARDMARNARDTRSETYHNQMLQKIKKDSSTNYGLRLKDIPVLIGNREDMNGYMKIHGYIVYSYP